MRLSVTSRGRRNLPFYKKLEKNMLAACRAAGGAAWYMPDDFLTLGPELVTVPTALVAGTSGYFYSDFSPLVGKSYQITYQYSVTGGTSVQMSLGGSNVPSSTVGSGTVVFVISATNNNPLRCYSNAATAALSGISVKEVLAAKDFQDSVGTLPTYLGGTVGMMFDAAGVTGPELIANPHTSANWVAEGATPPTAVNGADSYLGKSCRSVTFPVIASGGYAVCRARDAENIFNVVTGTNYMASMEYALSRDLTAGESISIAITGSAGIYAKNLASGTLGGIWMSASGGQPAVASGGGTGLRPYAVTLNAPLTVYVRAVSVKVAGGYVATQATAGNRPLVSRIPRKLGPELVTNGGGNTTDGWSARIGGALTSVSGKLRITTPAGNADRVISLSIPTVAGKDYVLSMTGYIGTLVGYWAARVSSTSDGATSVAASSNQTNSQAAVSVQFKGTGADVYAVFVAVGNATGQYGEFDDVSLREVLEWSNALTCDGSNDSLATVASVIGITLTQPYTMIAWGRVGALGAARRIVGDSARSLGIATTGKPYATNHGVVNSNAVTTMVAGQSVILESTWDGAMLAIYVNGTKEGEIASAAPTVPAGPTAIAQRGSGVEYWNSEIGGVVVCPAVMTDAQRTAVRKFAAAQMGLSI